ncbi:nuclear transport factor 2 family protein [Cryptosporangium minutisporangium]|uniref:Nuclear transport factor 2 family protein n=1 Tax=Cryptosporangium minutisporangium TaxID=113569 RepID=A0ABP6SPS3_9ACTN
MTDQQGAAVTVALSYYRAWTSGDLDDALTYLADDVVCDAPVGRIDGAAAYRAFVEPFARALRSTSLIAAYGDDERAIIVYDTASALVGSAPAAECVTVRDGKIVANRFIFDRLPFELARAGTAG